MDRKKGSNVTPSDYIDLFLRANESKEIPRTGWVREKVNHPESVAEHSFSVSFLTMQLAQPISDHLNYPLNTNKLIKMALLHDFGEIETGDIVVTRWDKVDIKGRDEKEIKEREGIRKMFSRTDKSNLNVSLFDEMVSRSSIEAKIFWQLDKLDMAIQALTYEQTQEKNLEEFYVTTRVYLTDPFLLELLDDIEKRRPKSQKAKT